MNIIITGDLDGDGYITGNDSSILDSFILLTYDLDEIETLSVDFDRDGVITGNDVSILTSYQLLMIDSLD